MSQEEQLKKMRLEILGDVANDTKDEVFKLKLDDAEVVALNTLYPYDLEQKELDKTNKRLMNWQARCAIELYRAMGKERTSSYQENSFSVTFLSSLVSADLKNELKPPKVGVPK
ncbi:MAG: hypothetical protein KH135_00630 [Firmicutes bacterium]|nr:hypothetical protein [Bacillota bacterium]